eukprot:TRINITY_DN1254_c0_g1_i9.p1 TRINITY_DN1254_c0_g1~~TRINITY_DN1254_c0_g1_i9.p1  ORF type:complete len:639 (-),score=159.69 TRINITY_DN1254_c0_g1_i9:117-2033(-)
MNSSDEEYDATPDAYFEPYKRKKVSKEEQIYGDFGPDEPEPEVNIKGTAAPLNFVRSANSMAKASDQIKITESDPLVIGMDSDPEEPVSPQHTKPKLPKRFGSQTVGKTRKERDAEDKEQLYKESYGIGFKLLKLAGFKAGDRIGKEGTGILEPIIPHKRPDRLGLGVIKEHSVREKEKKSERAVTVNEEKPVKRWKIGSEEKVKRKVKWEEKQKLKNDFADYKKEFSAMHASRAKKSTMTIIDMTKPQTMVMGDMNAAAGKITKPLLQIKSYVQFYLDQCRNANKLLYSQTEEAKNNLTTYKYERETLTKDIELTQNELQDYQLFIALYKQASSKWSKSTLAELFNSFKQLFAANPQLYRTCSLPELSANLILARTKREFLKWPVSEVHNTVYLNAMQAVQEFFKETIPQPYGKDEVLQRFHAAQSENTLQKFMLYFLLVLEEAWIPVIVSYISNEWDPKEPELLIKLCEDWKTVVPQEVMLMLYEMSIGPRIEQAVSEWDPLTDTMPIHLWIHPWLPILGLNTLTHSIEIFMHKVMAALKNWDPRDDSAKIILEPWKTVVGEKAWSSVMRRCVIPKLAYLVEGLEINPAKQDIEPLKQLYLWIGLVDDIDLIQIMKDFFFPKWVDALDKWIQKRTK